MRVITQAWAIDNYHPFREWVTCYGSCQSGVWSFCRFSCRFGFRFKVTKTEICYWICRICIWRFFTLLSGTTQFAKPHVLFPHKDYPIPWISHEIALILPGRIGVHYSLDFFQLMYGSINDTTCSEGETYSACEVQYDPGAPAMTCTYTCPCYGVTCNILLADTRQSAGPLPTQLCEVVFAFKIPDP